MATTIPSSFVKSEPLDMDAPPPEVPPVKKTRLLTPNSGGRRLLTTPGIWTSPSPAAGSNVTIKLLRVTPLSMNKSKRKGTGLTTLTPATTSKRRADSNNSVGSAKGHLGYLIAPTVDCVQTSAWTSKSEGELDFSTISGSLSKTPDSDFSQHSSDEDFSSDDDQSLSSDDTDDDDDEQTPTTIDKNVFQETKRQMQRLMGEDERQFRRRISNRAAAQRSRLRKLGNIKKLENQVLVAEGNVARLCTRKNELREAVLKLRLIYDQHKNAKCLLPEIDSNL